MTPAQERALAELDVDPVVDPPRRGGGWVRAAADA